MTPKLLLVLLHTCETWISGNVCEESNFILKFEVGLQHFICVLSVTPFYPDISVEEYFWVCVGACLQLKLFVITSCSQ